MDAPQDLTKVSFPVAIHEVQVYGLILLDLQGRIVTWNRGAEQLLHFKETDVWQKFFGLIFTPEDREKKVPEREMSNALQSGHAYDDRWHVRKDQSQIYVNGGLCLLKTPEGTPLGFVKIIRDQTEKKARAEKIEELSLLLVHAHKELEEHAATLEAKVDERTKALNERNKELQDFCYSVAHDLRAPLRTIQAMSQIVLEDYGKGLDETGREYLRRISKAGGQLDQLTLDLLAYTQVSRDEIQLIPVRFETALEEVLQSLAESVRQTNAVIRVRRPLPTVKGQPTYIVQIIGNFLSNALKFTQLDIPPEIEVWAESHEGRVRIFFQDNGIGISAQFEDKVFLLFERLNPHGRFEGTGAGLAIARKAAQRMGGEIGLLSRTKGGSTFWLELEEAE